MYKIGKSSLLTVLKHWLANPDIVLQRTDLFKIALDLFQDSTADFADCLILAESRQVETTLYTFDKRLSQHNNTKLL